jgi:hypothetical protein
MVWPVLEPGRNFTDNWHIHAMCSALEAVAEGRIRRLILSVPYRTSKSTLVGVVFPVWCWLRHPATRCTAPGCLDNRLRYAARLKVSSCQATRI